jgi:hypothetical protein
MNQSFNPRGVPLVADASFVKSRALTTIARACPTKARNLKTHSARNHWSDDKDLELVLRAPVDQATTTNTPTLAGNRGGVHLRARAGLSGRLRDRQEPEAVAGRNRPV